MAPGNRGQWPPAYSASVVVVASTAQKNLYVDFFKASSSDYSKMLEVPVRDINEKLPVGVGDRHFPSLWPRFRFIFISTTKPKQNDTLPCFFYVGK